MVARPEKRVDSSWPIELPESARGDARPTGARPAISFLVPELNRCGAIFRKVAVAWALLN